MRFANAYIISLIFALGTLLMAAPVNYANEQDFWWSQKKGNWNEAKNWWPAKIPSGFAAAQCNQPGARITLNSAVPAVYKVCIAGKKPGCALVMEKGAHLKVAAAVQIFMFEDEAHGSFEIKGGTLETGLEDRWGRLSIGSSATVSTHGVVTVSGGVVKGAITVGGSRSVKCTGKLVVIGNEAVFAENPNATPGSFIEETGVLEFIFARQGVSKLDFPKQPFEFKAGSQLRVDASLYEGAATKRIPLICASKIKGFELVEKIVAAQPKLAFAAIEMEKDGKGETVYLKISKTPN